MLTKRRAALSELRSIVDTASARYGVPRFKLWPAALDMLAIGRFSLKELRAYAPFLPQVRKTLPVLISKDRSLGKLARINPLGDQSLTENKETFYELCERHDIPHPEVCAIVGGGRDLRKRELPQSFIAKDQCGVYGSGFMAFERVGDDRVRVNDGTPVPLEGVLAELIAAPATLILQQRVFDHAGLQTISRRPVLQCARINTLRGADGTGRLLFWMIKLVVGNNRTDNFSVGTTGNLIAFGHRGDGRLEGARTIDESRVGLKSIDTHPESGVKLREYTVPLWDDAVATVLRAHSYFPQFGALGWDVAITADGPKILEANAWWDPPTYAPWLMTPEDWRLVFG